MHRPLIQKGIAQLEDMFAKCKADTKQLKGLRLKLLKQELQHRHVPRAVALLAEVQAEMCDVDAEASPARPTTPIPQQLDLPVRRAAPPEVITPVPVRTVAPEIKLQEPQPKASLIAPPLTMPLDEANKILKVAPGASWESIEKSRRMLMNQSHPSRLKEFSAEKRAEALANAKRVNAAYAVLSQTRCGGR